MYEVLLLIIIVIAVIGAIAFFALGALRPWENLLESLLGGFKWATSDIERAKVTPILSEKAWSRVALPYQRALEDPLKYIQEKYVPLQDIPIIYWEDRWTGEVKSGAEWLAQGVNAQALITSGNYLRAEKPDRKTTTPEYERQLTEFDIMTEPIPESERTIGLTSHRLIRMKR